ncbi:hypothetical protein FB451DRAFT_1392376 [Mycena latifolia]|nr:hypothetical protein FB451DRAFT_1392376 [Mycena latifolia]
MASPGENPPGKTSMTKSHTCRVCFKTFSRPSNLGTHMNMHNDVRRASSASHRTFLCTLMPVLPTAYACGFPGCPKMFSVRSNAQRHFRLHDETAPTPPPPPTAAVGRLEWRELQLMPELPPLPLHSLSQAPARFRWAPPNSKHYSPTFLGAEEGGGGTVPSGSAQGGNLARLTTCMTTHGVRGKPPVALPTTE